MGMNSTARRMADRREAFFRAVFGAGRSTGVGAERDLPLQHSEVEGAFAASFLHDNTVLYYQPVMSRPGVRMLFATKDGALIYSSDVASWQRDPVAQLQALARAVCPAQTVSSQDYGRELQAVSKATGETLRFSEDGDYVRIIDADDEELVYWNSDEFAEDPDLVCGALVGTLINGAS
jgi:hypothetical protein